MEDIHPLQAYMTIEKTMNGRKVAGTKTMLVNLGENSELELKIGNEIYISECFGKPWGNIRDYATIL